MYNKPFLFLILSFFSLSFSFLSSFSFIFSVLFLDELKRDSSNIAGSCDDDDIFVVECLVFDRFSSLFCDDDILSFDVICVFFSFLFSFSFLSSFSFSILFFVEFNIGSVIESIDDLFDVEFINDAGTVFSSFFFVSNSM